MQSKTMMLGMMMVLATTAEQASAERTVPLWEKNTSDQYNATYGDLPFALMVADQYGDTKLKKDLGDTGAWWGYVDKCGEMFSRADRVAQAVLWAVCGEDIKAVDVSKLKGSDNQANVPKWKQLGAALEAEAKDDPGIASILQQTEAAKTKWKDFEAQNHDAIALYQKLKDGLRSSKSNDKNFEGCWDVTQPPFAKAVKATKFSWDLQGEQPVHERVAAVIGTNPAHYYAVANFGMCSYAAHVTGGVLASAALEAKGGVFGWRTMLIATLRDPAFKPKFTDRSYKWTTSEALKAVLGWSDRAEGARTPWPGGPAYIQTGVVKTMKKDGDDTVVKFSGTIIEDCLDWKETNKLRTWDTAGNPVYERKCLKRGKTEADAPGDATMGTKFLDGFKPGVGMSYYGWFPAEVYIEKSKKFISILSVPVKGTPAETPLKE
jgi:hypothetical protein